MPPNTLIDKNGAEYNGSYHLEVTFIDSSKKHLWRGMPDGFIGYLNGKEKVQFETLNAMHIDLKNSNGEPLDIKQG